jgi:hypothetical protein
VNLLHIPRREHRTSILQAVASGINRIGFCEENDGGKW